MRTTLKICDENAVWVCDNLLYINCGFSRSNIIPIGSITFLGEPTRTKEYSFSFFINGDLEIVVSYDGIPNIEADRRITHAVHEKIERALIEYHTRQINITKPKNIK